MQYTELSIDFKCKMIKIPESNFSSSTSLENSEKAGHADTYIIEHNIHITSRDTVVKPF